MSGLGKPRREVEMRIERRTNACSYQSGQGTVEFALAMILFMFLSMGIVDFARAFFTQEVMQQAATAGARAAAIRQCSDTSNPPTVTTSIHYAIYTSFFSLDWSRATVTVVYENTTATVGRQVTVTVAYNFNVATPLVGPMIETGLGTTLKITGIATSTVEQVLATC